MGRAPCCEKEGLNRGRWTAEEDKILTQYIQAKGEGSWRTLPKNAGLLRCGKSCRLRWINYLREDLKRGNITPEEEDTIVKLHSALGNRWSLIAGHLPGRTDNEIKNYWNTHLSRKLYSFTTSTNESLSTISTMADACKRRGGRGRTRRSAMKKHKITGSNIVETSLPKPEISNTGSEVLEPPTKEEPHDLPGTTVEQVIEKSRTVGIGYWVPEPKVETRMNLGVQDSFLDNPERKLCHSEDSNSGGLCPHKEIVNSAVELWPIQTRESEVLGPVEWLDDERMRIGCNLEGGAEDRSGNAAHNELVRENGVTGSSTEERVNLGALETQKEITTSHEARESSVLSSNADCGELYTGSSSVYSGFNDWLDWDWVGGVECYNPWALWDERADKMLTDMFMGSWQR